MMSKPTKQAEILEIADVETLATLAKRLDTLASSQLGTQALSDIVVGLQLITALPPVIERLVQDTQRQIGPKADALGVHDAYQGWKSNVGSLLQLCSGVDESPISFREFSEHVSQILDCLNELMEQCRCAADDQVARANLQSDLHAISELIAQSMLSGWLPMWNAVKSKIDRILESGGTTQSAEDEIASFVDLWATSERIGSALVDIYGADGEWPVHQIQDETFSAWLLATLREVSQWGDHQLARMLKLRPSELPAVSIDLNPCLTAPVIQMLFEVEVGLASLRAKAIGAVAAMERIATLSEQAMLDGFVVRKELHEPISLLLSECVFDPEFLTALRACSVIMGVGIDEICLKTLLQIIQTTPTYLQTPRFAEQSDDSKGYHILSRVVSHEDVNVGYAFRVWAKQLNWSARVYQGPSDSFWRRLRELGAPGWWIITALLDRITAEEADLRVFLAAYLSDNGRFPEALLPLAALQNVDIKDEFILSLLSAIELLAFRTGCGLGARAIPIFIQRFAGQFPILCARMQTRLAAHVSLAKSSANSSLSGADLVQNLREQACRSVRPRNYKGVKCIEQLSRRFVDENAAPLLALLERATHADEIKNAISSTNSDLDVSHLIDQWGRDFLHGPEGRLRQRLIDDCKEMIDEVLAFGQKLLDSPDSTALKSLEEEIHKIRGLGSLSSHAADLMEKTLLKNEIPKLVFPGKPLIGNSTLALFPRTLRLWNVGNLSLDSYLNEFELDLREDVLDYAISEAATGRVGWAEQVLENLSVPKTHSKRLAVKEKGREWAELVELDRQELVAEIGEGEAEKEDLVQVFEDLTVALSRQDYAEAVEVLETMRLLASASHEAREVAKTERKRLSSQLDTFLLNVSRTKLPIPVRSEWTKQILMLQDELASGADLPVVQNKLAELQDRLTAGETPPLLLEVVAESSSSTKVIGKTLTASEDKQPHDPLSYSGIVKALVGTMYGFIVPFDLVLRREEDIYFHRNNVQTLDESVPELPPLGSIVGFSKVVIRPDQPRPSAQDVWILSTQEKDVALTALASQLGIALDRVGFVSGETLFTVGFGFDSRPCIDRKHHNSFVQFQIDAKGQTDLSALISDSSDELTRHGIDFFLRLAKRATSPKKLPEIDVAAVSASILYALHPSQPNTYRDAKVLQGSTETSEDHERVVSAIDGLKNLGADEEQVAWWRAVLVGSYLAMAKTRQEPAQVVLNDLTETMPDWFGPNREGTFILVNQALLTFLESNPQELSYEQIWSFFNKIQSWLGPKPHYRLELIQAYITIDDAEREIRDDLKSDLISRAEKHIKRAMVIHPRMTEPHDMLRQLETRFGKRRISDEWVESNQNDPVLATRAIRKFYDDIGGRADKEIAINFYGNQKKFTLKGLALDELIGRHCRYLLNCDSAVDAENLLLAEARHGNVENWSIVVELLYDIWIDQNLDVARIRKEINQLRDTLPSEALPHLDLLLGRVLFEKGYYESALRHADQAQVSLHSTESRQLLTKCRQVVQRGIEKKLTGLERVEAKDEAWREAQRIAAEGDSAALSEFILSHMDDSFIGPWLTLMCVSENGLLAHDAERRSLVLRSRSLEKSPSVELLKADIRVRWDKLIAQHIERLKPTLLDKAVKEPSALLAESSVLNEIDEALSDVTASFALYDALLQIHPSNLFIRWRLAIFAKKRWSTEKKLQLIEEYFQASLPCVGFSDAGVVSPAVVANDMLSMKLFGLSAIIAYFGLQNGNQALAVILKIAEEKATPAAWEWPSVLQRSRVELDEGSWAVAVNSVVCALLANPCHWPSCRAYLKTFSDFPRGEDIAILKAVLGMALWGVRLVARTEKGRQSPELLVLQAELVLAVSELEDNQVASDKAAMECSALCSQAQRLRQGFKLAITLQNRFKPDVFLAPGETYAKRYRIVEALTPGSYGQVYRAEVIGPKPGEAITVALKLVRADAPTPEKRQQQRSALEREARISRQLKHPSIVRVHDFIDSRCLVMEYIDGKTLASWIDESVLMPWQKALQIGIQVAVALEYASDVVRREFGVKDTRVNVCEFAHRDIHPRNIMVTDSLDGYQAKLLDFGLARVPGGTATTAVFEGVNRRLVYRAPEYGTRMLDHRGDMFALGVILYQLITGEDPYPCDVYCDFQITQESTDVASTLRSLDNLAPPDTAIPNAFAAVLARMVAFRSADRPNDWTSVIRDLRDVSPEMTGGSG